MLGFLIRLLGIVLLVAIGFPGESSAQSAADVQAGKVLSAVRTRSCSVRCWRALAYAGESGVHDGLGGWPVRGSERLDQVALSAGEHGAHVGELAEALLPVVAARAALTDAAERELWQRAVNGG